MSKQTRKMRAAPAALVAFLCLAAGPAAAEWSEFGFGAAPSDTVGPEIREPFFEFLLGMVARDSVGEWSGADLRAFAAAKGRESRFPLEEVLTLRRERPDPRTAHRYEGATVRAMWTLVLNGRQDHPMPYSILGYHPGSLRLGGVLVLSELGPVDLEIAYGPKDDRATTRLTEVRIFPLERGFLLLDADGFLDALLGAGLDDAWILGFVTGREDGRLVGLGVSLGRKGRHIFGEFDFSRDKILPHGRRPMAALSSTSRRWLTPEGGNLPEPWVED